jgi:hypothetical protein
MDVCLLCLYVVLSCVGRGLCDWPITRPDESYRVSVSVWSRNPEKGGQKSILDYKRLWMNEYFLSSKKITVFWYVAPYTLAEFDRHFRDAYFLRNQGDKSRWWMYKHLWNASQILRGYMMQHRRRQSSLYSPQLEVEMTVCSRFSLLFYINFYNF